MLEVTCPCCQKRLQLVHTAVDHDSQCPACGTVFRPEHISVNPDPTERRGSALDLLEFTTLSSIGTDFFLEEWRSRKQDRRVRRYLLIPPALLAAAVCAYIFATPTTRGFGLWDKLLGAACAASVIFLPSVFLVYTLPTFTAITLGLRKAAGRPTKPVVNTLENRPESDPHFEERS